MAEEATGSDFGPGDTTQETALDKRRAREAARLARIQNPKQRIMGIDSDALALQVEEKRQAAAAEKALRAEYDQQRLQQDAQLAYLEQERLRAERQKAALLAQFQRDEQGRTIAREYDLNDPKALLNELPGRVGDDDARNSVSGMQKFHGEDLNYAQRIKAQQQELRAWNAEMVATKAAQAAHEKELDAAFADSALMVDSMKTDLESTAKLARTQTNVAVAEYQLAQTAAKAEREAAAQLAEMQDNIEEIQKNLAGDLLTENPAVGRSFAAPNRLRPDHYKGMAPAEQAAILDAQETQRLQRLEALAAAKAETAATDAVMEATRRAGAYQDAQVAAMRAEIRKKISEENVTIAGKQQAAKQFLKTEVFTNSIEARFYDQFCTSSR